jgi:2-polyprenyl-6-hydroxyphenyl methylase/3-demethylubiquinone-9 3-methyltransferase
VRLLGTTNLAGQTFLDIGSGSGLMSLAALRLGAKQVISFDYDSSSVACTRALRLAAEPALQARWEVQQGSVLDEGFVQTLGQFDVVYSWGVLHHTGQMWRAIELALTRVKPDGLFVIAIYNRVGARWNTLSSHTWQRIKRAYVTGSYLKKQLIFATYLVTRIACMLTDFESPWAHIREYQKSRGMSWLHDARDWIGGYPFEYASHDEIGGFVQPKGFALERVFPTSPNGYGNNEFVFRHSA